MQRIGTSTRVIGLFGVGKDGFQDGNPSTGAPATQLQASWFNSLQEEIARLIEYCGLVLDGTYTQLLAAIRLLLQRGAETYAVDTGAVNALVVQPSPALTAIPADGMGLRVQVAVANTGVTTLTLMAGTPAVPVATMPVVRRDGTPLQAGDLIGGQVAHFVSQAGAWQLITQAPPGAAATGQAGLIPIASAALVAAGTDNTAAVTAATIGLATMPISAKDYGAGSSYLAAVTTTSAQMLTAVTPAQNPNGIWLRTFGFWNSAAYVEIYADTTAPSGVRDQTHRCISILTQFSQLQAPLHVAAGWGVYVAISADSATYAGAPLCLTYDIQ